MIEYNIMLPKMDENKDLSIIPSVDCTKAFDLEMWVVLSSLGRCSDAESTIGISKCWSCYTADPTAARSVTGRCNLPKAVYFFKLYGWSAYCININGKYITIIILGLPTI